jgi:eukaryotic-like serine/threonine-protein kinase
LANDVDRAEELRAQGLLAAIRWSRGEEALAQQAAQRAADLISHLPSPTAHYLLEGYAGVAEVSLALWEASNQDSAMDRGTLARQARQACAALQKFAHVFPIGQPRAWLMYGLAEWLSGRSGPAQAAWQKSLAAAEDRGMIYEQGRAHDEIGRHLPVKDLARQEHLARAEEIFAQISLVSDPARLRAELDQG